MLARLAAAEPGSRGVPVYDKNASISAIRIMNIGHGPGEAAKETYYSFYDGILNHAPSGSTGAAQVALRLNRSPIIRKRDLRYHSATLT